MSIVDISLRNGLRKAVLKSEVSYSPVPDHETDGIITDCQQFHISWYSPWVMVVVVVAVAVTVAVAVVVVIERYCDAFVLGHLATAQYSPFVKSEKML